jgi:competence ComEA-like helix-hairpin-helix protein
MHVRPIVFAAALLGVLAVPLAAADKVQLNEATTDQLTALGLTPSQAMQIVRYRKENGDYLQIEELLVVPQISRETFVKLRDKVKVDE